VPELSDIENSIRAGAECLKRHKLEDNFGWGWSEFIGDETVVPWGGTSDGILALLESGESSYSPYVQNAVKWLKNCVSRDGGWTFSVTTESAVDSTCWVILALVSAKESLASPILCKAIEFIEENQNEDEGWGYWKGQKSRVYSTSLTLRVLSAYGRLSNSQKIQRGKRWLIDARNEEGVWGFEDHSESRVPATIHAILGLLACGMDAHDEIIEAAVKWLLNAWKQHNSWPNSEEDNLVHSKNGKPNHLRTRHLSSPWAIIALLETGHSVLSPPVIQTVHQIISSNGSAGCWCWGEGIRPTVWATYNCIHALRTVCDSLAHPGMILALYNDINKIQELQKDLGSVHSGMLDSTQMKRLRDRTSWIMAVQVVTISIVATLWVEENFSLTSILTSFVVTNSANIIIGLIASAIFAAVGGVYHVLRRMKASGRTS
jgi:prenyltransferase beta subunit